MTRAEFWNTHILNNMIDSKNGANAPENLSNQKFNYAFTFLGLGLRTAPERMQRVQQTIVRTEPSSN